MVTSDNQKYLWPRVKLSHALLANFSQHNNISIKQSFWCSRFCEFCRRRYYLKHEKRYKYQQIWNKAWMDKIEDNWNQLQFFSDRGRPQVVSNFSFETKTWRWQTYENEPCTALRKEGWLHTVYHGNIELTHLNWACCCTNWKDCQYHMPRLEHCSTQTEALTWLKLNFQYFVTELCIICHDNILFELKWIYVTGKN